MLGRPSLLDTMDGLGCSEVGALACTSGTYVSSR